MNDKLTEHLTVIIVFDLCLSSCVLHPEPLSVYMSVYIYIYMSLHIPLGCTHSLCKDEIICQDDLHFALDSCF